MGGEDDENILMGTAAHNTFICEDLLKRECENSRGCVLSADILMGVPCQRRCVYLLSANNRINHHNQAVTSTRYSTSTQDF